MTISEAETAVMTTGSDRVFPDKTRERPTLKLSRTIVHRKIPPDAQAMLVVSRL